MTYADHIFSQDMAEHARAVADMQTALAIPFARLVDLALSCLRGGGKILFFGNGGSAADAQHLATELVVRFRTNRPSISGLALTTDTSALTAIGNDFGFDDIFSRQIEGLGRPGDVAIGISTSGNSPNILKALDVARKMGLATVGFGGGSGGAMVQAVDVALIVPSKTTARIQECHILLGHMLCAAIECELGFAASTGGEG